MGFILWALTGVGLAMDAFAVSLAKGLSLQKISWKEMSIAGLWFGGFQILMPVIGFYAGRFFAEIVSKYDSWIAFLLLALIGGNMIREAVFGGEDGVSRSMKAPEMFMLAVATSIDALAVGVSYAFMKNVPIWPASLTIGAVTFLISAAGVKIGSLFGSRYEKKAKIVGGIILILIGIHALIG